MENTLFEESLLKDDKILFDKINKGDLHTHCLLSSNRNIFKKLFPEKTLEHFEKNNDIRSLSLFIKNNIINISTTQKGHFKLFECSILTAISDGITNFETSVDYRISYELFDNNLCNMITELNNLKEKYKHKINLKFDLGISRNAFKLEHTNTIISLIKSNVFNGIDLYGDELSKSIKSFKKIYKVAKKENLILKAHVGEFGTSKDIMKAIKTLKLKVIQHGISIIDNKRVMKFAKRKKIQFNVCPISNVMLQRVSDISQHPIKTMYENGLCITINTDDQLIFENSLFDEYNVLFKNNVLSIDELNEIRNNSLK